MVIPGYGMVAVPTGLAIEIRPDLVGMIKDRSSIALKRISVGAGVIDSDYRGEVKVIMFFVIFQLKLYDIFYFAMINHSLYIWFYDVFTG